MVDFHPRFTSASRHQFIRLPVTSRSASRKSASLVVPTSEGLWCREGGFHIDPWTPVAKAVITHAHSDHATPGCESYLTSTRGSGVLQLRMGPQAKVEPVPFGKSITMGNVRISLHPAGHILGSAQVRVERITASDDGPAGEVCVVTGDYKVSANGASLDPTCDPFEPVRCHTLITESTFGLPIYRWANQDTIFRDINSWWRDNAREGRTSIIFAYALGKAQRVLAGLDASIGPIGVHGSVEVMCDAYTHAGVQLPKLLRATGDNVKQLKGQGLIVAPPSTNATRWMSRLRGPEGLSTSIASGWMMVRGQRRRRSVDRGFVLSDHADWDGLLFAIKESRCERVGVTHGYVDPFVRYLKETTNLEAFVVPSRYEGERIESVAGPAPDNDEGSQNPEEATP